MEIKKYPQVDLERYHSYFFEIGFVLALGLTYAAFEWSSPIRKTEQPGQLSLQEVETELIPITRPEPERLPEPQKPVIEILHIVTDDTETNEDPEIEDSGADEETIIDIKPVIDMGRKKETEESPIFISVDEMPEFPGGEMALRHFLVSSIKYPVIAQENNIQGKVYVTFVVGIDGRVSDARIIRGIDPSLDKEAIRVVSNLPPWKPGKQGGKAVRVQYSVPINFMLEQ